MRILRYNSVIKLHEFPIDLRIKLMILCESKQHNTEQNGNARNRTEQHAGKRKEIVHTPLQKYYNNKINEACRAIKI